MPPITVQAEGLIKFQTVVKHGFRIEEFTISHMGEKWHTQRVAIRFSPSSNSRFLYQASSSTVNGSFRIQWSVLSNRQSPSESNLTHRSTHPFFKFKRLDDWWMILGEVSNCLDDVINSVRRGLIGSQENQS